MTKLNKKLSISICVVVIFISFMSLLINQLFISKYYLYEKKKIVNSLGNKLEKIDLNNLLSNLDNIEEVNDVVIVYTFIDSSVDNIEDEISENLNREFFKKGISLKKFWISREILVSVDKESTNRIFNQGKSKYSLLVKFLKKDDYLFAIGTTIEHSEETIKIVNKFNIFTSIVSVLLIMLLTITLSNRITKPLKKLKILSRDISKLNFRTEEIKTNDEIEELADSINRMCLSLEKAHNELNNRNETLKNFIADASHELKTPVALIKAYTMGVQDGMDDGTFLDTILEQNENLSTIINSLLYWAKYEKKELNIVNFDLKNKLNKCINKYRILFEENNITLTTKFDSGDFYIDVDDESIDIVLNNLITNAIKYTTDNKIDIFLLKDEEKIILSIKNGVNNVRKEDIEKLWEPFYVVEKSRNKDLSGTGLGLTITKGILDVHKFEYGVDVYDSKIEFYIIFK